MELITEGGFNSRGIASDDLAMFMRLAEHKTITHSATTTFITLYAMVHDLTKGVEISIDDNLHKALNIPIDITTIRYNQLLGYINKSIQRMEIDSIDETIDTKIILLYVKIYKLLCNRQLKIDGKLRRAFNIPNEIETLTIDSLLCYDYKEESDSDEDDSDNDFSNINQHIKPTITRSYKAFNIDSYLETLTSLSKLKHDSNELKNQWKNLGFP